MFLAAAIIGVQLISFPTVFIGGAVLTLAYIACRRFRLFNPSKRISDTALLALNMIMGYLLYRTFGEIIKNGLADHEAWGIILSRLSLFLFVMPFALAVMRTREKPLYLAKGTWRTTIHFPWIFKGPLKDPIWRFMLIFLVMVCAVFSFFMDWGQPELLAFAGYALSFALINAVLEELLWRGYILSHFVSGFGELKGLVIAGVTFGLYHYHLGFSWPVCLLFSIFGIMMGGVAIRSKGLAPVMVMHFVMNVLFVLSGMIL
ncbi:CPBP family intramembrane glutamic endopeptidase [Paenibacillus sp. cl141a]|uniref:CPBP family intramembrane glutamic endopeptidase n=1 Tax=Paenibacillus sp. cl141a TaxID=1761877 RepID=UPI0020C8DD18|nr:CPBP family intramembrane glutamic endopeptidase [Paenibacillus sp. cl141a]